MTGHKPALLKVCLALLLCLAAANPGVAGKATDLMSLALKNKAAGKLTLAIEQLEQAIKQSKIGMQKNLALFMMGDCQLEMNKFSQAAKTFQSLRESVSDEEERAEATFRLLQAETYAGNKSRASRLVREMKRDHRTSAYYDLARSFVEAQGLIKSANSTTPEPAKSAQARSTKIEKRIEPEGKVVKANPKPVVVEKKIIPAESASTVTEKKYIPTQVQTKEVELLPEKMAQILKQVLTPKVAQDKEGLVAQILVLQDKLKDGPGKAGMDKVLFDLASLTEQFGETLEACKLYDQVLTLHPNSGYAEESYYEAIRLRAILGVHEAVVSWAQAFLAAFPASEFSGRVKALIYYSEKKGKVDLSKVKPQEKKNHGDTSAKIQDESNKLQSDRDYAQASRKMKDGKYNLALIDLKKLAKKYPGASKIWWDMALVYVQFEDFPAAESSAKRMLQIDPDNEEGNSLIGYIHYRLEDYQQAANAYGKAGEPDGKGVTFFDAKSAAERMKKSVGSK